MNDEQLEKSEIEKIFGSPRRVDLFDEDEQYYSIVRPNILLQPAESFDKKKLPFSGVRLLTYIDYCRHIAIEESKKRKRHIFYIKSSSKGNIDYCDAAGYYDNRRKVFVIIKYSFISSLDQFLDIDNYFLRHGHKIILQTKCEKEDDNSYLIDNVQCPNPVLSASYVLGKKARIGEWVDDKGKNIYSYYPELLQMQINSQEFVSVIRSRGEVIPKEKKDLIYKIVSSILASKIKEQAEKEKNRHLFYIEEQGICMASGYYEPQTNYFYILADSLVALSVDNEYSCTNSGNARLRFIDKACKLENGYYRVIKDAKCRSASAAACYSLGRTATYVEWIDKEGKGLKDYFPQRFFRTKEQVPKDKKGAPIVPKIHLFYIRKYLGPQRICDAKGYYDYVSKAFLLLEGSMLALDIVSSYRYTTSNMSRRMFVNTYCEKQKTCYRLKKDVLVDSPSIASDYVLGQKSDGRIEWIDNNGKALKDVYHLE